MPVNLSSLFSAINEVSPVNNKEAQSAENAGNTSGAQNISGTIQKTADEAGIAMLKNMLKGDTFSGQIKVFAARVPATVKVGESIYYSEPLLEYAPGCNATVAYMEFGRELIENEG